MSCENENLSSLSEEALAAHRDFHLNALKQSQARGPGLDTIAIIGNIGDAKQIRRINTELVGFSRVERKTRGKLPPSSASK